LAILPVADRNAFGRLGRLRGVPLEEHLTRLDAIRDRLLAAFRNISPADFRRASLSGV
jgi:hypothetical protein